MDFTKIKKIIMSNQRQRGHLLEENIQLKKEQLTLNQKIDDLYNMIDIRMKELMIAINQIRVVNVADKIVEDIQIKPKIDISKNESARVFIPSTNIDGMKVNVSPIEKRTSESNLTGAVDALAKLQIN